MAEQDDTLSDVREDIHGATGGNEQTETEGRTETATGVESHPTPTEPKATARQGRKKKTRWSKARKAEEEVKKTRRHGKKGRHWRWDIVTIFQPIAKWKTEGRLTRPKPRETIAGCVYYAIKKLRNGTDEQIHKRALRDGLASLTVQATFPRVQVELRELARLGVVKRMRRTTRSKK